MHITEQKRPVRGKNKTIKKILRYLIALPPFLIFMHVNMMLRIGKKTEKYCYKLLNDFNLLNNYKK